MTTNIKTVHEEQYSDNTKTLGILLNFSEDNGITWKESFPYIYNHKNAMYIFFNTMIDMFDYLLYADNKVKRAYMEENVFDSYYDTTNIDGKFTDVLIWIN